MSLDPRARTAVSPPALLTASSSSTRPQSPSDGPPRMTVASYLDRIGIVLAGALPAQVWIEATVVGVRPGQYGDAIDLVDPTPGRAAPPQLRVFLAKPAKAAIARDLGVAIDTAMLVGMTTSFLTEPSFDPRWHVGARVVGLAQSVTTSLRRKLLDAAIETLRRERLFDRQRGLPTPRDVTRIAILHPAASAGWGDVAGEPDRWRRSGLILTRTIEVPFESGRAAAALVATLADAVLPIAGHRPDLILVLRGGGARSALAALDDEAVARSVCRCPVPVVSAVGHAMDVTLLDMVSWRRVDTPSKALTLIRTLMIDAGRQAIADQAAIVSRAAQMVDGAEKQAMILRQQLDASAARTLIPVADRLSHLWSGILGEAAAAGERLGRLRDAVDRALRDVRLLAPDVLMQHARNVERTLVQGLDGAQRQLARVDDGAALLSVMALASRDMVLREAVRLATVAETELTRAALVIESTDLIAVLRRDYVVVSDTAGRILRSRDAAARENRLVLTFADGTLDAVPMRGPDGSSVTAAVPLPPGRAGARAGG